jgi:hypothetical protein
MQGPRHPLTEHPCDGTLSTGALIRAWVVPPALVAVYLYFVLRVLWRIGDEGTIVLGAQRVSSRTGISLKSWDRARFTGSAFFSRYSERVLRLLALSSD